MRVDQLSMHGFDKGAADRIGRALRGIVERGFATGNSIAIGRGGARVYEEYCGYADLARTAPVDESTKFRVYSMTKVVTAVAVMQLWEQGVFSLNDPVSAYIPSFAAPNVGRRRADGSWELRQAAREIMVRDLLTMTSGIPYTATTRPDAAWTSWSAAGAPNRKLDGPGIRCALRRKWERFRSCSIPAAITIMVFHSIFSAR